jgi:hypothetical protein
MKSRARWSDDARAIGARGGQNDDDDDARDSRGRRRGRGTDAHAHTQVYPIFVAIGGACSLSAFFITRQLATSPGFTAAKSKRMAGVREEPEDFKEGKKWREHSIRRAVRGMTPQIMPGLNASMSGGQH